MGKLRRTHGRATGAYDCATEVESTHGLRHDRAPDHAYNLGKTHDAREPVRVCTAVHLSVFLVPTHGCAPFSCPYSHLSLSPSPTTPTTCFTPSLRSQPSIVGDGRRRLSSSKLLSLSFSFSSPLSLSPIRLCPPVCLPPCPAAIASPSPLWPALSPPVATGAHFSPSPSPSHSHTLTP